MSYKVVKFNLETFVEEVVFISLTKEQAEKARNAYEATNTEDAIFTVEKVQEWEKRV